jgi:hypothetical protein
MSIYIEGVNLPELSDYSKRNNTPEVYNLNGAIVVYPDGKVELKSYIGTFEGTYNVISVPPHGRLGDLDALPISTAVPLNGKPYRYVHIDNIENAPTIIPAEEG